MTTYDKRHRGHSLRYLLALQILPHYGCNVFGCFTYYTLSVTKSTCNLTIDTRHNTDVESVP